MLNESAIAKEWRVDRIDALERLGIQFESAKQNPIPEDFVNVEHQGSN
jgi:hypothetical protein